MIKLTLSVLFAYCIALASLPFPGSGIAMDSEIYPGSVSDGFPIVPSFGSNPENIDADTTINICVIKVEFLPDYTDSTSGNGEFESDSATVAILMEQVKSYYEDVSNGYLQLNLSQYPENDAAFRVNHQMGYYGNNNKIGLGQAQLFQDAILQADDTVDFSRFNAVIVMHAGAGAEADILQNSPNDIHSMFLNSSDLNYYLGVNSIQTNDGVVIREGCVDPEREAQDNYGLGVLGTIVHEFGHQLGLPDLYNTYTGAVGVGGWDLMGYGQWLLNGFWPAAPGAWSKIALGWLEPQEIIPGQYSIQQMGSIYKIPFNSSEYLLIENRQRDPDGDGQCGPHDRDYGLSGSGILIWHIDESRLGDYRNANIVNVDPLHKGVDVEEADGIQDLDYGFASWFSIEGSEYDPWKRDGYGWEFTSSSVPSSDASWGGYTGVAIDVLDNSANLMNFSYTLESFVPGWPVQLSAARYGSLLWETLGEEYIVTIVGNSQLFVTSSDGSNTFPLGMNVSAPPVIVNINGEEFVAFAKNNGEIHLRRPDWSEPDGWPVNLNSSATQIIASESMDCLFVILENNEVYRVKLDGSICTGWPISVAFDVTGGCIFPHSETPGIILVTADGSLRRVGQGGLGLFGWPVHPGSENISLPLSCDFDRDNILEVAVVSAGKIWMYNEDSSLEDGFPVALQGEILSEPFMADLDSDGYIEILVETTVGMEAFTASGTIVTDWPFVTDTDSLAYKYSALTSGIGGSGFAAATLRDGRMFVWNGASSTVGNSPFSFGDNPIGIPILHKFSGEENHRLMNTSSNGLITAYYTSYSPNGWHTGLDRSGSRCWLPENLPDILSSNILLNESDFFVWPNPVITGSAKIRFVSGRDANYRIRIFNVAGELVDDFSGFAVGSLPREVNWSTDNLAPGVYYVCLELTSSGETAEALFHAAVVN